MSIRFKGGWKPTGVIKTRIMEKPQVVVPTLEWTTLPSFPANLRIGDSHQVSWATNVVPDQVTYQWRQGVTLANGSRAIIPEWRNGNRSNFYPSISGLVDCQVTVQLGDQTLTSTTAARGPTGELGSRVFYDSFESTDVWTVNFGNTIIISSGGAVQGTRARRFDPVNSGSRSDIMLTGTQFVTVGKTYRLRIWGRTMASSYDITSAFQVLLWNGNIYENNSEGIQTTSWVLTNQWRAFDIFWIATSNSVKPRILSQTNASPSFMLDNISIYQMN